MRFFRVLTLLLMAPTLCGASVQISEVAWMGTANDANDEWIELYNDGAEQDLTGWTLTAVDGQPAVALEGSIPSGGYFLLERTNDSSVPDITADLIYTGALGNDGETLELKDSSGVVVDSVNGSDTWSVGGDNTAKFTLQRARGGWVTAEGTPKRSNASSNATPPEESPSPDEETNGVSESGPPSSTSGSSGGASKKSTGTKASSGGTSSSASPTTKGEPFLSLSLGSDVTAVAGAPVTLTALVRDERGVHERGEVRWTFGDGTTGTGTKVRHTYKFPGTYVVNVKVTGTGVHEGLSVEDRLVVLVESLRVAITHADLYSIELTNMSERDLDLSDFALAVGKRHFRIPQGTVLLAGGAVRFPSSVTGLVASDARSVGLFFPSNARVPTDTVVARAGDGREVQMSDEESEESLEVAVDEDSEQVEAPDDLSVASDVKREPDVSSVSDVSPPVESASLEASAIGVTDSLGNASTTSVWWYIAGLVALIAVAGAGVVLIRREEEEDAYAYDIIDMDERGEVVEEREEPPLPRVSPKVRKR